MKKESVKILSAAPLENYRLKISLSNGKKGVFDMLPYMDKGVFTALKKRRYFSQVRIVFGGGGIGWPGENAPDLSASTIEYGLRPAAKGETQKRWPRVIPASKTRAISSFGGIKIYMPYPQEPGKKTRITAKYGRAKAEIAADNGRKLRGNLPPDKRELVDAWLELRREDIAANCMLAQSGVMPFEILPLWK